MKALLSTIITLLGSNIAKVVCSVCDTVKAFFLYKQASILNKIEEREQKKNEEFEKKVDNVTKNGDIEDLLNLKR